MIAYTTSPVFDEDLQDPRTGRSFREEMVQVAGNLSRGIDEIKNRQNNVIGLYVGVEVKPHIYVVFDYNASSDTLMAMKIVHRGDLALEHTPPELP